MAPRDPHDGASDSAEPAVKGFVTLAELGVGMKVMAEKDGSKRKAEILSIQTRKGQPAYYVHYEDYNKRLDEWIYAERIDLEQEVEWPVADKSDEKKRQKQGATSKQQQPHGASNKSLKRPRAALERADSATPDIANRPPRPSAASGKENNADGSTDIAVISTEIIDGTPQPEDGDVDANGISLQDVQDAAAAAKAAAPHTEYSREAEIEKLRTSGSMTQNQAEISRVRNLTRVQMGRYEVEPWYFSPYPQEYTDADMVYICEFCLDYFPGYKMFQRHRLKCEMQHPPGNEIYRDDKISFFEIDGRRQRTWCRNLCLLSKLFLDHKTLYYDVDPFLFYCMTVHDDPGPRDTNGEANGAHRKGSTNGLSHGHHLTGYFSKEKESAEGYNVACILTLPQFQRRGFGRLLIAFSYELSKREGKLGSPEKPLSDLGLLGYRAYWQETIVDLLTDKMSGDAAGGMTVEEIGAATAMTTADVLHTLQNLNMLRFAKNQHVMVLTEAVADKRRKQKERDKEKAKHFIDPNKLIWKPPVFTASSRTWNW